MLRTSAIVAASFIAGVSAVQVLHAQSKAPVYSVSVIDIKDNDGYKNAVPDVRKRIGDMGGKYLVAAGVAGDGRTGFRRSSFRTFRNQKRAIRFLGDFRAFISSSAY